eukprot:jgi/Picre1/28557/NNA_003959.t1
MSRVLCGGEAAVHSCLLHGAGRPLSSSAVFCSSIASSSGSSSNRLTHLCCRPRSVVFQKGKSSQRHVARMALLDPPSFNPRKLKVVEQINDEWSMTSSADTESSSSSQWSIDEYPLTQRRYTLTHNDLTGSLTLSIGSEYNKDQLSGWYTKILRDEVLAEWTVAWCDIRKSHMPALHVYCHVSGEEMWPAPPGLRSFIFQREMTLVLDTIAYADRDMLAMNPDMACAGVYVHLASDLDCLDQIVAWGSIGDRSSWQESPQKSLFELLFQSSGDSIDDDDDTLSDKEMVVRVSSSKHVVNASQCGGGSKNGNWLGGGNSEIALRGVPSIIPAAKLETDRVDSTTKIKG